eukprot:TRINITY_DN18464_c0_g1_i2.p5 TRINITY_DN18464_c0_g1~~TRINITY_DN18464_c0_g1_i2.p5  ORF type:complete len:129 (-),score=24.02 TRINITY_DN18464_c0_g1_i2:50-436(-)
MEVQLPPVAIPQIPSGAAPGGTKPGVPQGVNNPVTADAYSVPRLLHFAEALSAEGLPLPSQVPLPGAPATQPFAENGLQIRKRARKTDPALTCLLYTSDAADEEDSVDLGGRRIIKKKKKEKKGREKK